MVIITSYKGKPYKGRWKYKLVNTHIQPRSGGYVIRQHGVKGFVIPK